MGALWLMLALSFACSPQASKVPLGLGPLAVAERDADAQAESSRREKQPKPARRSPVTAPAAKELIAKEEASSSDAKDAPSDDEKGSEKKGSGGAAAPARFAGMYAGYDIAVFRLTGLPDREQRDDKAKIRIEDTTPGNVSITLINSEDGSDLCELAARVEGNAALLETAQPCFTGGGEGSLQAELTSGRAVVEGDKLRMDAEGTLSVALPDQELDGDLTYTFEGDRQ